MNRNSFPDDFLWGASTASHQVEGGNYNQWSVWEQANAEQMAKRAEGYLKSPGKYSHGVDWDSIDAKATDPDNYVSGAGVDHYNRYKEDFSLLQSLNMNAFRFGIEWSRVEPQQGEWDEEAIAHYHAYIADLKSRGIEPILTLWHWTMPVWFTDKGGFANKQNLVYFDAYVAKMSTEFGSEVDYVLTLNEPNVYASMSYIVGEWPPQQKSLRTGMRVYRNLMQVHNRANVILKRDNPNLQVGLAMNLACNYAKAPHNLFNRLVIHIRDHVWNLTHTHFSLQSVTEPEPPESVAAVAYVVAAASIPRSSETSSVVSWGVTVSAVRASGLLLPGNTRRATSPRKQTATDCE